MVVFNIFHLLNKSLLLGTKCVSKHQDLQIFGLKLSIDGNFHLLEVVGRGSESQLQVGEILNTLK